MSKERLSDKLKETNKAHLVLQQVATELGVKIDLRILYQYTAYMQGARAAILRMAEEFPQIMRGKNGVYNGALIKLATSELRQTETFLNKSYTKIIYDNYKLDRKGKAIECDAHFARTRSVDEII